MHVYIHTYIHTYINTHTHTHSGRYRRTFPLSPVHPFTPVHSIQSHVGVSAIYRCFVSSRWLWQWIQTDRQTDSAVITAGPSKNQNCAGCWMNLIYSSVGITSRRRVHSAPFRLQHVANELDQCKHIPRLAEFSREAVTAYRVYLWQLQTELTLQPNCVAVQFVLRPSWREFRP